MTALGPRGRLELRQRHFARVPLLHDLVAGRGDAHRAAQPQRHAPFFQLQAGDGARVVRVTQLFGRQEGRGDGRQLLGPHGDEPRGLNVVPMESQFGLLSRKKRSIPSRAAAQ